MRMLTMFLYTLIALSLGIIGIGLGSEILNVSSTVRLVEDYLLTPQGKIAVGLSGALIVLMWFRLLVSSFENTYRRTIVISSHKESFSTITVAAIEEILRKLIGPQEHLKDIRVRIVPGAKRLKVFISLVVTAGVNIADFLETVQTKTRKKLVEILGEDKRIIIKVEIKRVAGLKIDENAKWEPQVPYREYS